VSTDPKPHVSTVSKPPGTDASWRRTMRLRRPSSAKPVQPPVKAPSCGSVAEGTVVMSEPVSPEATMLAGHASEGVAERVGGAWA